MFTLHNLSYRHSNQDLLFSNVNLAVNQHDKTALVGNNGVGKSTLLRIIAGELPPSEGQIKRLAEPFYIPQVFGQFNHLTIAQALRIDPKINALHEILEGNATEENFTLLNDDWTIEDRCRDALNHWEATGFDLLQTMDSLSGGQKTKVLLAGIAIHQPDLIVLDEPTNNLDIQNLDILTAAINEYAGTLLVVSHDERFLAEAGVKKIMELSAESSLKMTALDF